MSDKNVNIRKSQEVTLCLLAGILMFIAIMVAERAEAGMVLGVTRVIYPTGQKQEQPAVADNDENSTYLIQSWMENANGVKDGRFIVAPPLFAMKGKRENTLRILDTANDQLPRDRESLFWMNVKAIPSVDKSKLTENTLQLAIISRIKLYYYPAKSALPPDQAVEKLEFHRSANSLTLVNLALYYLTVTELNIGAQVFENALVSPMSESAIKLPSDAGNSITYRTINDYGALTPKVTGVME